MDRNNDNSTAGVLTQVLRFLADILKSFAQSLLVVVGTFVFYNCGFFGHALILRMATVFCAGGWIHRSWRHAGALV